MTEPLLSYSKQFIVLLLHIIIFGAVAFAQNTRNAVLPLTLIRVGRLLDVKAGKYLMDQGVLIAGGRIKDVGAFASVQERAPKDARLVDLSKATVLPGLIDCHTHLLDIRSAGLEFYENNALRITQKSRDEQAALGAAMAREVVEAGWTTVRDLGDAKDGGDVALRDRINARQIIGPRMLVATRKLTPPDGQHIRPVSSYANNIIRAEYLLVHNVEDARRGVREAVRAGADVIKVIVDDGPLVLRLDEMKAIVEEAHRLHVKVAAHAHIAESTKVAVEAGADSIEHAYKISDESLRMMREKGIFFVPTDITREAVSELLMKTLPPNDKPRPELDTYTKEQVEYGPERLRRALNMGVKIAAGSDMAWRYPGKTRGQQSLLIFDAYLRAGMPPIEIVRAATINAAELLGWQDRIGSIETNKYADIIAVEGDPLNDIGELQRIKFVMKDGVIVRSEIKSVPSSN